MRKLQRKIQPGFSKRRFKTKLIKELESMCVPNPGMNTDIDSYNYGIYESINRIKKTM